MLQSINQVQNKFSGAENTVHSVGEVIIHHNCLSTISLVAPYIYKTLFAENLLP